MVGLENVTFRGLVLGLAEVGLSRVDSEENRDTEETKRRGRTISTREGSRKVRRVDNARRLSSEDVKHVLEDGHTDVLVESSDSSQVGDRVDLSLLTNRLDRDRHHVLSSRSSRHVRRVRVRLREGELGEEGLVGLALDQTLEEVGGEVGLVEDLGLAVVVVHGPAAGMRVSC